MSRPWSQDFRAAQAVADSTFHRQKLFRACLFRSIYLLGWCSEANPHTRHTHASPTHPHTQHCHTHSHRSSVSLFDCFNSFFSFLLYVLPCLPSLPSFDPVMIHAYDKYIIYIHSLFNLEPSCVSIRNFFRISDRRGWIRWYSDIQHDIRLDVGEKMRKNIFPRLRCRSVDRYIYIYISGGVGGFDGRFECESETQWRWNSLEDLGRSGGIVHFLFERMKSWDVDNCRK